METGCTLYHTFQEGAAGTGEAQRDPPDPPRPCPRHMSVPERLRKVIQELVDTEKSYVKVSPLRPLSPPNPVPRPLRALLSPPFLPHARRPAC